MESKKLFFSIPILFILLSFSTFINAQQVFSKRDGSFYTYIYKISSEEAIEIVDKDFYDIPDYYLHTLVDSVQRENLKAYQRSMKVGHYLLSYTKKQRAYIELFNKNSIEATIFENERDFSLGIYKIGSDQIIESAIVHLNNKKVPFNTESKSYTLEKSNKKGVLRIEVDGETLIYECERDINNSGFKRASRKVSYSIPIVYILYPFRRVYYSIRYRYPLFRRNYKEKYDGYILFNKPKYLPNDTLHWKAYVTTHKGKPIKDELSVKLSLGYGQSSVVFKQEVKADKKGAYFGKIHLSDSLELDRSYYFRIGDFSKSNKELNKRVYIEEYELDESFYSVSQEKEEYFKNEKVTFTISAKDVNGFNLLDSRVKIQLKYSMTKDFYADKVFIPEILYEKEMNIDPIGNTIITIPDSVFPEANIKVLANFQFNNSHNEIHTESEKFSYNGCKYWIESKLSADSIYANLLMEDQEVDSTGELIIRYNNGNFSKRKIAFPFKDKIDCNSLTYEFYSGLIADNLFLSSEGDLFECLTYREKDSLFISFSNPRNIPIHYFIYKKMNKIIDRGYTTELDIKQKVDPEESFIITCHYMWAGEAKENIKYIYAYKDLLSLKVDQPKQVYPGQIVDLNIKVEDINSKPVEGVNITVGSTNGKFEEDNLSSAPYNGKYPRVKEYINTFDLSEPKRSSYDLVDSSILARMNLDTIPFYTFSYPKDGIYSLYDSTYAIQNAQFSPHIFSRGYPLDIYLIYIDEQLVYYVHSSINENFSFVAEEGYHSVRVRCRTKEFFMDSVLFKNGYKLELFLDANNLGKDVVKIGKPDFFDVNECLLLNNSFMGINNNFKGKYGYLKQNDLFYEFGKVKYAPSMYKVGPIIDYELNLLIGKNYDVDFTFEPGFVYTFEDNRIIMKEIQLFYPDRILKGSNFNQKRGEVKRKFVPYKEDGMAVLKRQINRSNRGSNFDSEASFKYEYTGDSTFCMFQLKSIDSTFVRGFVSGNISTFIKVPDGDYQMLFYTCNKTLLLLDSIHIQNGGLNFYRFGDSDFQKLDSIQMYLRPVLYTPPDTTTFSISYRDMQNLYAHGSGILKGNISDFENDEPIPFAAVVVKKEDIQVAGTASDFDGNYTIKPLKPGVYDVYISVVGYNAKKITGVIVSPNKISFLDAYIEAGVDLECVDVVAYSIPLIVKDGGSSGGVVRGNVSSYDIAKMPLRDATSVAATVSGVDSYRGARAENTYYYIDGVKVIGYANLPKSAIQEVSIPGLQLKREEEDKASGISKEASGLRADFSDYAFWFPNLYSDENGEVKLQVTFPDNVTKWETFVLAMNDKKQSGTAYAESKSIKPLLAQIASPRFLVEEDTSMLITRVNNYTKEDQDISTTFSMNDSIVNTSDTLVEHSMINTYPITSTEEELKFQYTVETPSGFMDGESRSIPVYKKGLNTNQGEFHYLNGDTSIAISLSPKESSVLVRIHADEAGPFLDDINYLKYYSYTCMEQTASRLLAYLIEWEIESKRDLKNKNTKEIKKLIKRLVKGQNEDGSWGWWPNSGTNYWMTIYVMNALNHAQDLGFQVLYLYKSKQFILHKLDYLYTNELLFALEVLSTTEESINYNYYLKRLEKDTLSDYQSLLCDVVKQNIGAKYSLDFIEENVKETFMGSLYWEEEKRYFYDNSVNMTTLAYQLIAKRDSLDPRLPKIRSYFMEIRNEGRHLNTIDRARLVTTILPGIVSDYGKDINMPELELKGSINATINEYPYTSKLVDQDFDLSIHKKGNGPIFLNTSFEKWDASPERRDSSFSIDTWFEYKGERLDSIPLGEIIEMKVRVLAKKKGKYLMIQVPIPAGCSYGNNDYSASWRENHREYHKDKTIIYVEQMNEGEQVYTIQLQSRYKGKYTLNPAKVELMYMPVFNGNNELRSLHIY